MAAWVRVDAPGRRAAGGWGRLTLAVLVVLSASGCRPRAPLAPGDAAGTQTLYRVEVDDGRDSGTLRLVVRERGEESEIEVADRLGRALWKWLERGRESVWLDLEGRRWCPRWLGHQLAPLPPALGGAALRRLLRGEIPEQLQGLGEGDGTSRAVGDAGRWTVERSAGRISSWSLERDGELAWWWRGSEAGGTLSSRQGVQVRWRRVVTEPLAGSTHGPLVPEGFERDCRSPAP